MRRYRILNRFHIRGVMLDRILSSSDAPELLSPFPPTRYAFAYGSAALPQAVKSASKDSMLDLILAVDEPAAWHAENIRRNTTHYAWLARLGGAAAIARVQESRFGARLWYNALVTLPGGRLVKYGVITADALAVDALEWSHLYSAGRHHKPVAVLQAAPAPLAAALDYNRRAALRVALLLLPANFTVRELFTTLTAISYGGDWRMTFGECPSKITDIVDGAPEAFAAVYAPLLAHSDFARAVRVKGSLADLKAACVQNADLRARVTMGQSLPLSVQRGAAARALLAEEDGPIFDKLGDNQHEREEEKNDIHAIEMQVRTRASEVPCLRALWSAVALRGDPTLLPNLLRPTLSAIVAPAAKGQAIVGVLTAGPEKAAVYAAAKLRKFFTAVRRVR